MFFVFNSLSQTAQWCFSHMYYVRVNEIKYLYLFGPESAKKRKSLYQLIFRVVLAIEIVTCAGIEAYEI